MLKALGTCIMILQKQLGLFLKSSIDKWRIRKSLKIVKYFTVIHVSSSILPFKITTDSSEDNKTFYVCGRALNNLNFRYESYFLFLLLYCGHILY